MPAPSPAQRAKVNAWMAAFRYGGKVDDLSSVDGRRDSGQYDEATWNIALDGATWFGFDAEFRAALVQAVAHDLPDAECEKFAYNMVARSNRDDGDPDYQFPEWAEAPA